MLYFPCAIFLRFYLFIHERHTESERQRHRQREKQAPCGEPDVGLDHDLSRRQMLNHWATWSSHKLDFKPKTALREETTTTKDEETHYAIIKGSIQRENWTIISFNASKVGAANYINRFSVKISFIYLFDTEREQKHGQQEREKQTPHWTGSLMRASSQDPENMTWPKARA